MQKSLGRILTGGIFFLFTMLVAIVGYVSFGWTTLESLYMVVITIFGVGYGEVKPLETPEQKIFTMFVIIAGTSSAVYAVGGFVQMITEGELNRVLNDKKRQRTLENLQNHIIVAGFGYMGQILAQQLNENRQPFVVIDQNIERVNRAESFGYTAYQGDATDETTLETVGITKAKVIAIVLPQDTDNVFITLTARGLNPNLIIMARGEQPSTEKKLRLAGADHIILPATLSALRIANLIARPTALDFLGRKEELSYLNELLSQLDVQLDELAIENHSSLVGKTIQELEIRSRGTFIIVALRRLDGTVIVHPAPSLLMNSGDIIMILGHKNNILEFADHYELKQRKRLYRGIEI